MLKWKYAEQDRQLAHLLKEYGYFKILRKNQYSFRINTPDGTDTDFLTGRFFPCMRVMEYITIDELIERCEEACK